MDINNSMYVCRVLETGLKRRLARQQVYLVVKQTTTTKIHIYCKDTKTPDDKLRQKKKKNPVILKQRNNGVCLVDECVSGETMCGEGGGAAQMNKVQKITRWLIMKSWAVWGHLVGR